MNVRSLFGFFTCAALVALRALPSRVNRPTEWKRLAPIPLLPLAFILSVTVTKAESLPPPLKVLAYNIKLLPNPPGAADREVRASLIPTVVSGYDAIVFEEAFEFTLRHVIIDRLAPEYPYHTRILGRNHGPFGALEDGGVMIFSKWPIEREFQSFYGPSLCAGWDCLAEKGVMYARLNVNGRHVHIFGTHTQADDDQRSIRQKQLVIIRSLIESMAIPADQPVLIAGDLNVNLYNAAEYNAMLSILAATHPEPQSGNRGYTHHPDNWYVPDHEKPKYLDYVLYSNNHLKPDQAFNDVRIFKVTHECIKTIPIYSLFDCDDLSDHYAIEGNLTFSGVSRQFPPSPLPSAFPPPSAEPLGTFPFVVLFKDDSAQHFLCNVSMKYRRPLGGDDRCYAPTAVVLYDVPAGRVLRLVDAGSNSYRSVEIIAKRNLAKKMITFERSFEDDDVRVIVQWAYTSVWLNQSISALEVDCLGGCNNPPTLNAPVALSLPWYQQVAFTVNAIDNIDLNQVKILASGLPAGATLLPTFWGPGQEMALFKWQPGPGDIGEHTIAFVARDSRGGTSAVAVTTITVTGQTGGGGDGGGGGGGDSPEQIF